MTVGLVVLLFSLRDHPNSEEFIKRFFEVGDDGLINVYKTLENLAEAGFFLNDERSFIEAFSKYTSGFTKAGEVAADYTTSAFSKVYDVGYYVVAEGGAYVLSWIWGS